VTRSTANLARAFRRAHGLGNDYLVVDGEHFGLTMDAARARLLCDRHRGVGSDGVLVGGAASGDADIAVRIFNPDGSEAEKSGNGVRIFAADCFDRGLGATGSLRIETLGGLVTAQLRERRPALSILSVSMGVVRYAMRALPMLDADGSVPGVDDTWVERALMIGGRPVTATCVSVGNPHAVLLSAPCDEATLLDLGPQVEHHAQFPQRTNVQLCEVLDRGRVRALIWERGAGPTLASGSSACAVVAACARAGHLDLDRDIEVVMPGGSLSVRLGTDGAIEQTGPVEAICEGLVAGDLWNALVRA
jgi:diaminopimelate epimerase